MLTVEWGSAPRFGVACAAALASPKDPADSQDRASTVLVPDGAAAVICDGVGSQAASSDVADRCVQLASAHIGLQGVGAGVVSCADTTAQAMAREEDHSEGATTLVAIGARHDGQVYFSLVGNGAVFALEPLSVRDGRAELLRSELAIPQTVMDGSQAALRSFLPAPHLPVEQTSGWLSPRRDRPRLLLACSDGVTTAEECRIGHYPATGEAWGELLPPFVEVLEHLARGWGDLIAGDGPDAALATLLEAALDRSLERGVLDDDATTAAVLVQPPSPLPADEGKEAA